MFGMKKFYSSLKNTSFLFLSSFLLICLSSNGQTPPICGPVAQDFQNTSGSTAGFTGDFRLGSNGGMTYLKKANVISSGVYTVTTPTYQLPASATYIGYGFMMGGTQNVARAYIKILYISTLNNELTTVILNQIVPAYAPGTTTSEICQAVSISSLPGFPAGGAYRLSIELTPNNGSGLTGDFITFDDFRTNGTLALAPLPVTFTGFDAKKINNLVQLTWYVAGEENVARYEVERSSDGRRFARLSSVSVLGKSNYQYTDAVSNTTVYYRIKNVDNDGSFKYSTIVRFSNGRSEILVKAFPQPVQNQLFLQHPVINGRALISLSTADGRTVGSAVPAMGSMQTTVDMSTLQKGLYLLRFDDGNGEVRTLKVIKQ